MGRLRTVDILAACPYTGEFSAYDVATELGVPSGKLGGHLDYLEHAGMVRHVRHGIYALTDYGRKTRGPDFGAAA